MKSNIAKELLKSRLPPMAPRSAKATASIRKDYSPTEWKQYFHEFIDVKTNEENSFRVYLTKRPEVEYYPLILLLHGGGYSGLSWCVFVKEITDAIHCQCMAIDFRGHGETKTADDTDLSADTLANDVGDIIKTLYPENQPNILLMGHSMGGAIAVQIGHLNLIRTLIGCVVIDVVEGTAMESLTSMQSFLRSRPNYFKSIPNAIEWCVRSGQIRNLESARVSMPSQIVNCETKKLAINELPLKCSSEDTLSIQNPLSIPEDAETPQTTTNFAQPGIGTDDKKKYTWRIDLSKSEKYWTGWFEGLSNKFLGLIVPKLLILAGIDNLDKTMTVGQMQGKFQLQVLARTGHAVHEDSPLQVSDVVASYLVRHRFAEPNNNFVRQMPAC